MATIPVGNFGQAVAAPSQAIQRSAGEFGAGSAKALGDLAQTVGGIATQQIAQQTKLDQEVADRDAQTAAARVRITKSNEIADAQDQLGLDVQLGKVPKADADKEWQVRSREILKDATTGIDPRYAGAMQVEFDGLVQRGSIGVRRAVTKRNQDDVQANLLTLGEEYQRAAQRDRAKAQSEYFAQLDVMGPEAGWAPDVIAQKKQQFKEGTAYTEAFGLVQSSKDDLSKLRQAKQLVNSDRFIDIDPQRRAQLDAQLAGYETNLLAKRELAAQRAQRESEARLNRARSAFEAYQARATAGIPDNSQQADITVQALAGTPYLETYQALQQQVRAIGGFAAQPVTQQQSMLDALNSKIAQSGTSDALIKQRDMLQRALDASENDLKEDALRAGLKRGVITDLAPVDTRSIDGFTRSVASRLQSAQVVQAWAGRPVSPLTSDEAQQVGQMLNTLPVQQRASALATLGTQLGPQAASGLAAQIDKQDKALSLALQFGSNKTTEGRYTSEIILKGQQAIKDKAIKVDAVAESGWRATIAKEIDGAYPNERQAADVKEAAYLITAGLAAEGNISPKQAVRLAAGGEIVEHNGKKIPLPAQVEQSAFEERLRNLKAADFSSQVPDGNVRIGGQTVPIETFVQAVPDAPLISLGRGRYAVTSGGRIVTNAKGSPIVITAKP